MKSSFARRHPAVSFTYFVIILGFTMWFNHPICLAASLAGAVAWSIYLKGKKAVRFALTGLLPMFIFMWVINPLFSHAGVTILAYFPSGNPLTLESILYGLAAAIMLCAAVCWFSCCHEVMTSDRFIYLFGRIIPALSLLLSMVLRFVPRFKARFQTVSGAQRCVGRDISGGNLYQKCRNGVRILSVMITWSLESSIETADSMKSRGYGLPGRTAYSLYRFDEQDRETLTLIVVLTLFVIALAARGELFFRYFPMVKGRKWSVWSGSACLAYLALCMLPAALDWGEDRKWRHSAQKI